jgi:hypothetical protein
VTSPTAEVGGGRAGISGSLEDVSVADVMQFVHLGRRTGTLVLTAGQRRAMVGFVDGKLVSARVPGQPKLGDLLVASGVVDRSSLERAVDDETRGEGRRSLGQILLAEGAVEAEDLRRVVVDQIETAISEVVGWTHGTFDFVLEDLRPVDDIALHPGDVIPDADLNTQMVLLEAARLLDEQREGLARPAPRERPAEGRLPPLPGSDGAAGTWTALVEELDDTLPLEMPELQVVTSDRPLVAALEAASVGRVSGVRTLSLDAAGGARDGGPAPVVVVDLRQGRYVPRRLEHLRRRRPMPSVVALVEPGPGIAAAYDAGAVAALPADAQAVLACLDNIVRSRAEVAAWSGRGRERDRDRRGVERLRRVLGDLRSGLLSATVALNLMHIMSESVERAVLFLVKRDAMVSLGAFGVGRGGRPLAELTRGLRVELGAVNLLTRALDKAEAVASAYDDAGLPAALAGALGPPKNGRVMAFPVLGSRRVISVIYTDNGDRLEEIDDVDVLELATAQVGMAFENELLRRRVGEA